MSHPLLTIRLAIKRLYDHEMAPIMERYTLTRMELDVLLFLGSNPGCDTAAQIVQLRMMTKSHISKAVEHLTELGFLTQARDEQNRRRKGKRGRLFGGLRNVYGQAIGEAEDDDVYVQAVPQGQERRRVGDFAVGGCPYACQA